MSNKSRLHDVQAFLEKTLDNTEGLPIRWSNEGVRDFIREALEISRGES